MVKFAGQCTKHDAGLTSNRVMRACIRLAILAFLGVTACAVFVAEGALHIWNKELPGDAQASAIARADGAGWRAVEVRAADGVRLDGWLFTPRQPNGAG